jgi:hypothetical protein
MRNHVLKRKSKLYLSFPFLQPYHISNASLLMVCEYHSNVLTALRIKLETFPFFLIPSGVSCLPAQNMFMIIHSISWPWDTRSSQRSIFLQLFPLSFSSVEQESQRNWSFMMTWINLFKKEDHRVLVKIVEDRCEPSLFSYLGISGRDSCKVGRSVTALF